MGRHIPLETVGHEHLPHRLTIGLKGRETLLVFQAQVAE
jgi:hypothetical protein